MYKIENHVLTPQNNMINYLQLGGLSHRNLVTDTGYFWLQI